MYLLISPIRKGMQRQFKGNYNEQVKLTINSVMKKNTYVRFVEPYNPNFLIYSITKSSNKYFTEKCLDMSRLANVELTSFETQFVTIVILC